MGLFEGRGETTMGKNGRLVETLPSVRECDQRLGELLRELRLARGLRRLAERAEMFREIEAKRLVRNRREPVTTLAAN
jgi:hypothetical protein